MDILNNDITFSYEDIVSDKEVYSSFLIMCCPCIMPQKTYVYMSSLVESDVNEWFTVDDEALCIVLLENSLSRWNEEYLHRLSLQTPSGEDKFSVKLDLKTVTFSPPRYSTSKQEEDKKNTGWTCDGINRFMEIKDDVVSFRTKGKVSDFSTISQTPVRISKKDLSKVYTEYCSHFKDKSCRTKRNESKKWVSSSAQRRSNVYEDSRLHSFHRTKRNREEHALAAVMKRIQTTQVPKLEGCDNAMNPMKQIDMEDIDLDIDKKTNAVAL